MTGFNALAIKDYDKPTSNWLLSYLNMATSSYGLILAALAARIATTNANAVYALFGVPAVISLSLCWCARAPSKRPRRQPKSKF
ncbi:hypothetical protein [Mesorhizobium sp. LNHC209A00]|uniref:hypothetical protein n=1 Tax=Mesorhizobium TaxID=68287 RepID=UPI0003F7982F|nr:hypothetical protein [Mesorhizobium sp. LNHC209A00]